MHVVTLTDHYELSMLDAALDSGAAHRDVTIEVFARRLPPGYRYGVVAGQARLAEALEAFTYDADTLEWMVGEEVVSPRLADWLSGWRFGGTVTALQEGQVYAPGVPVLTVDAPFGHAVLLETLVLSILNHDSAVATRASHLVAAAAGRGCLEVGSRRTHEQAAVAAARAAHIAGFDGTANLEAHRRYGVPSVGTSSHAFTLVHDGEREAFDWLVAAQGADTTLLVDTYEVEQGIRNAVAAAGPGLAEVRIDSGDPAVEARRARALLDELGATGTRVMVTGDLDEHTLAGLADAPIDAYGFGTHLVTALPAPGFVYKPVALDGRPVAKTSSGKATVPGRKHVHREYAADGTIVADHVLAERQRPADGWELLQHPLVEVGDRVEAVQQARRLHQAVRTRLADAATPVLTIPDGVHPQRTGSPGGS